MLKDAKESTSLTADEAWALGRLAEAAGLTRSALLRMLALDGLRRYSPEGLVPLVDVEARRARLRLELIKADADHETAAGAAVALKALAAH